MRLPLHFPPPRETMLLEKSDTKAQVYRHYSPEVSPGTHLKNLLAQLGAKESIDTTPGGIRLVSRRGGQTSESVESRTTSILHGFLRNCEVEPTRTQKRKKKTLFKIGSHQLMYTNLSRKCFRRLFRLVTHARWCPHCQSTNAGLYSILKQNS